MRPIWHSVAGAVLAAGACADVHYIDLGEMPIAPNGAPLDFVGDAYDPDCYFWYDQTRGCIGVTVPPRECGAVAFLAPNPGQPATPLEAGTLIEAEPWDGWEGRETTLWRCDGGGPQDWAPIGETRYLGVYFDSPAGPGMPMFAWLAIANTDGTAAGMRLIGWAYRQEINMPIFAGDTSGALPCAADFNRDGGVDGADIEYFYTAWMWCSNRADVNQDGGVDGADVEFFFRAWEPGGCD